MCVIPYTNSAVFWHRALASTARGTLRLLRSQTFILFASRHPSQEAAMPETRRRFVMTVAAAASSLAVDVLLAPSRSHLIMAAQRAIIPPPKHAPAETQ